MEPMPKDLDKRKEWVRDKRRKRIQAEKEHKDRIAAKELDEIDRNVDMAWSRIGTTHSNPVFSGFGDGVRGASGTYVWRDGRLVRK